MATAGAFLALLLATLGTGVGLLRAAEEARAAREAEARARALNRFLFEEVFKYAEPDTVRTETTLRDVLVRASENLDKTFPEPLHEAEIRMALGNLFWEVGQRTWFERHTERAVELRAAHLDPEDRQLLLALDRLADLREIQGRYDEAEKLRLDLLATQRRVLGPEHGDTLLSMNNLARLYLVLGRHDEARQLTEESLALFRRQFGELSLGYNIAASRLAEAYRGLARYDEAESLQREAIRLGRERRGWDDMWILSFRSKLASLLAETGRGAEAESIFSDSLQRARHSLRRDHQVTGAILRRYGDHLARLGRYEEAEEALLEAQRILTGNSGAECEPVSRAIASLAELYQAWGKPDENARWRAVLARVE